MHLGDLARGELTLPTNAAGIEIVGLTADSRAAAAGFLFAALPGVNADGAAFAADAVSRGAVAVLASSEAALDLPSDIPVLRTENPRLVLARMAAAFYPRQPERMVAVTGTSGKTSVADFTRQIFAAAGHKAASIGTLGVVTDDGTRSGGLTTPDSVSLHAELDRMAGAGIDAAAVEASSHGLDQQRLHALRLKAAGYTNLGRDHLDYHRDEDEYFAAKLKLFSEVLPSDGTAVVNMDDGRGQAVVEAARQRGQAILTTGWAGAEFRLDDLKPEGFGQRIKIESAGAMRDLLVPLAGEFQISNALVAAGLAVAAGIDPDVAHGAMESLKGAPGRLEFVGRKANGAMVFVDYAHKPEALDHVLSALRPMTAGRLFVLFGAGGDRDHGKRPLMGAAAARGADVVIVTDDNPRSEDPAEIRVQVLSGAPGAMEIADRGQAVEQAIAMLQPGDVLCVAGKGHETGQIVGGSVLPFSDHEAVLAALGGEAA